MSLTDWVTVDVLVGYGAKGYRIDPSFGLRIHGYN